MWGSQRLGNGGGREGEQGTKECRPKHFFVFYKGVVVQSKPKTEKRFQNGNLPTVMKKKKKEK
jgi:hypothetical protein